MSNLSITIFLIVLGFINAQLIANIEKNKAN